MNNTNEELKHLSVSEIHFDEALNCRGVIPLNEIVELAEDIKKNGQLMPVMCRYRHDNEKFPEPYVLVAGFSRTKAIRELVKIDRISAVIRHMSLQQAAIINAAENLKRRDLNIMQEAEGLRRLAIMGMGAKDIAEALGKTYGWVQPRLYALSMDERVQVIAREGYLTGQHIRDLYSLTDPDAQFAVAMDIKRKRQSGEKDKVEVKKITEKAQTKRNRARIARKRSAEEIENLLLYLADIKFPRGIERKCLAWAAGNISDQELLAALQTSLIEDGRHDYFPPADGIPKV